MFRNDFSRPTDDVCLVLDDVLPDGQVAVVTLKVYLDLGEKPKGTDRVVSVAATVFRPDLYLSFTEPWNQMLARWGAPSFHASEFYPGYGLFARDTAEKRDWFHDDCLLIPGIIGQHLQHGLIVSFRPDEVRAAAEDWLPLLDETIHSVAVQLVLILLGHWANWTGFEGDFLYFMERGDEDEASVMKAVRRLEASPITGKHIRLREFFPIKKGVARGLEASDFLAWHWNKYWADKITEGKPDELRKDFQLFVNEVGSRQVAYVFVTGKKLDLLLNLQAHYLLSLYDAFSDPSDASSEQPKPDEGPQ